MNILAHTKYGVFETSQAEYDEEDYKSISDFLERLPELKYLQFETDEGDVYFSKELIADSLFILQK
jgi:hypothetical protein